MQDLQALAGRLLSGRERVWLGLSEPPGQVQRRRGGQRTKTGDEVLAEHLLAREELECQHPPSERRLASKQRARTDLPIEPPDVRVRDDLGDDRPERLDAELRRAVAVEAKVLAEPDRERGALLGRGHREELARLERGLAALAVVRPEHRVACDGEHLRERGLEELRRGRLGRQDVRVRCVVLYPYRGQQSATARPIT